MIAQATRVVAESVCVWRGGSRTGRFSGAFDLEMFSKSFLALYFAIIAFPIAFSAFTKPRREFFETVIEFHIGDFICASPVLAVQPI
ncbi:hypothetical protein [Ochrobactrum sp. RH2CCR150]|uniref:hypothetical protein n=1 Tax=Ochrobactrum sp. RH2CCR150 TaxID=2587044 RepID=UPI0015FBC610|nr:hypothetical protein [Ochrobactrum sp. RH2CCR150]